MGLDAPPSGPRRLVAHDRRRDGGLLARVTRLEIVVALAAAVVLAGLVAIEPDILEAPFQNGRTLLFTFGGTALAVVALLVMLRLRVPPPARLLVLGVPFVAVNWWLLSPYFVDDVVDDEFATTIAAASGDVPPEAQAPATTAGSAAPGTEAPATTAPAAAPGPVLLGSGRFVGLAGHEGTGDAGIFRVAGGAAVLRFEDFDIENGPDLHVYLVPGADRTDLDGAVYVGRLRGNVGDQTYDLPADAPLTPGPWTVLVWCEAFSVEFVGATLTLA